MNEIAEHQLVSVIAIAGCLILALGGWRAHNVERRRAFYMAGAWAGIFAIVILFVDATR